MTGEYELNQALDHKLRQTGMCKPQLTMEYELRWDMIEVVLGIAWAWPLIAQPSPKAELAWPNAMLAPFGTN